MSILTFINSFHWNVLLLTYFLKRCENDSEKEKVFSSTNYYRNTFWFREIIMAGQDFFLDPSQFPQNLLNSQNINELRVSLHNLFDDSKLPRCVMVAPIWPLWPFHNDAIPGLTMLPPTHSLTSSYKAAWWRLTWLLSLIRPP